MTNTSPEKSSFTHKLKSFLVGDHLSLVHVRVRFEKVRFVGLTGHHDPQVLLEAMNRFPFDTVLVAINPADGRYRPFIPSVVAEVRKRNMGVVGMKALAAGRLLDVAPAAEFLRYTATHADTVVVGCSSVQEVRANLAVSAAFTPMSEAEQRTREERVAPRASVYDSFKG